MGILRHPSLSLNVVYTLIGRLLNLLPIHKLLKWDLGGVQGVGGAQMRRFGGANGGQSGF